jgi:hypothetical protein
MLKLFVGATIFLAGGLAIQAIGSSPSRVVSSVEASKIIGGCSSSCGAHSCCCPGYMGFYSNVIEGTGSAGDRAYIGQCSPNGAECLTTAYHGCDFSY